MELDKLREENVWLKKKLEKKEFMYAEKCACVERKDEQIDKLKAIISDLELSNDDKAAQLKYLIDKTSSEKKNCYAIMQDDEDCKDALIKENKLIEQERDKSKYENEAIKAKNINLQAEFELQGNENKILMKKIQSLTASEANLKSLYKEEQETLDYVRATVDERDCEISECHKANQDKDEVIEQQKQIIVEYLSEYEQLSDQNESMGNELAECKSLSAEQQKTIRDLEDELQMRQEENIHRPDQAMNWREECRILGENTDSFENQRDESLLMNIPEGQTEETTLKDVDPADEIQSRPSWFGRAKNLLKAGLYVGVTVGGTLLATGITKMIVDNITGSDCFSSESDCNFVQQFTSLHYIQTPSF